MKRRETLPFAEPGLVGMSRQLLYTLVAGSLLGLGVTMPGSVFACGWWGDAENDTSQDVITVDGDGQVRESGGQAVQSPEALTRQANRLRRFGASGHAGAVRLYRQAAQAGYAPAQNNLAAMYEEGLGVAPDLSEAARWYRLAAGQGEAHAQHSLGEMLLAGRGIERNPAEGIEWIERAASQGHASACADLGRFYSKGEHLEKNLDRARYWWQQAARSGYPNAQAAIEALKP
ncbi:tetratricopeptide repeat protein [Sedimenticola hydrogenitrophicus]|uniref:tetratricopeptide repeat protein n=1 Tax=Sedimenticola hydrogenitrophicus TaxID=2967975 RepID=UPI0021A91FC2|nr:tetratricopeptide repeat protein [Sedimenticola hydrogenitrophicus]